MQDDYIKRLEEIPNQCGVLILNLDGSIHYSNGDLTGSNSKHATKTVLSILQDASYILKNSEEIEPEYLENITVAFHSFQYVIVLGSDKIYIVKKEMERLDF